LNQPRRRSTRLAAITSRNTTPTAASVRCGEALVQPVRVDHREGRRQRRLGDVVVRDDDVDPDALGLLQRGEGGDAAIDGNDERSALAFSV
jgi:hypothetical protein